MDIETFRTVAADLFGNGWQTRTARALGIDGSTVRRWLANSTEVPPTVGAYLAVLGDRQETRGALLYEQLKREAVAFDPPPPVTLNRMTKKLNFPGVQDPKLMPAIHLAYNAQGQRIVRLDCAAKDAIVDNRCSLLLVRHPDGRHLEGYLKAAAHSGQQSVVATHRFHHYTLVLRPNIDDKALVTHVIATHAGEVRIITASVDDLDTLIGEDLRTITGH